MGMRKGKRLVQGGLICLASLFFLFVVLEIGVRIFRPQQETMRWMLPDTRYGHVIKPNFHQRYSFVGSDYVMDVQTNSKGLRDEEIVPLEEGEKTILFLGDSFTFGHGVEVAERFDTLLDGKLNEGGRKYRLINAGVQGWGTLQETRYAVDHFEEFAPDIIVITFCRNDPSDSTYFLKKGQSFDAIRFPGKVFLRNNSHLYRFLNRQAFLVLFNLYTRPDSAKKEADVEAPSKAQVGFPISDSDWKTTCGHLDEFIAAFEEYNPDGRVFLQGTSPWLEDTRRRLAEYARNSPAIYVDHYEAASKLGKEERGLPHDAHWSHAMHRISADGLFDAISGLGR